MKETGEEKEGAAERAAIPVPHLPEPLRTRRTYRSQKWRSKIDPGMKWEGWF